MTRSLFFSGLIICSAAGAQVLPEERADVLYHSYDGGGVQVDGPSLLLRKNFGESFSVYGNYYVDSVSSASIDVVSTASPYAESREQKSVGVDYLHGKNTISLSLSNSDENDYTANSANFSVSHTMFGSLTTVTMGYLQARDEIRRNNDATFQADVDRRHFRLGLSQILTPKLLMGLSVEAITDEGFLNNPYRAVRYLDSANGSGYSYEPELYPNTRTSNAIALRGQYRLPYRAAIKGEYRYFEDTWGIEAKTAELSYVHPFKDRWTFDLRVRNYGQNSADFYRDLFGRSEELNFRARDKELSTFGSQMFGVGVSYEFIQKSWGIAERGSLNLQFDHFMFDYDDFRDVTADGAPGTEPLYEFAANVLRIYVSVWF
ncbi:MAG: DUF3570 domain-containing protein [Gammaproteobacteria bacterium]|nr:DUF3570 domain-containing protein [Gammaproteobacteria bacterium]